ncbi:unnamed protein product [Acanthoscelides obtectus]|uniref:Uncharacterized protein n=1 Tax=Acanthoscelides obtectus TaxID=200917 RepID=A0A9P0KXZ7_ACAOB|nr:unnamed protein product [Acanthoscelides obtectus]CAK1675348.1 hypothetical protein AOBTE_LOCUS30154 [Acanthoscelides obtectus]
MVRRTTIFGNVKSKKLNFGRGLPSMEGHLVLFR